MRRFRRFLGLPILAYVATDFLGHGIGQPKQHESYGQSHSTPPPRRWHAARKAEAVLRLLRGESLDAVSRERDLPLARREAWLQAGLAGLHAGLSARSETDPVQLRLDDPNRRIGELSMEIALLRLKAARALPFPARRSLK